MSLPATVVAELELDSRKPPPDKNEEERKKVLIRKEIRKSLIHIDQQVCGDRRSELQTPGIARRRNGLKSLRLDKTTKSLS